jgi:high-affinity iron transporter
LRTISPETGEHRLRIAEQTTPVPALRERIVGPTHAQAPGRRRNFWLFIGFGGIAILGFLVTRGFKANDTLIPITLEKGQAAAVLDIGILVFREGLECVLVLAALTASMRGAERKYQRPVSAGVGVAIVATLLTWYMAVHILDDLGKNISALAIQAGTGLLAILVLLVVMNWFFHKLYWTGWISLHNQRKRKLLSDENGADRELRVMSGMALLGFTSFYREGFEVVLFLQSYRLKLGSAVLVCGVLSGVAASGIVAALTFVAHRRLPYRRMLEWTGLMLAIVLLVMVGEEAQEMQLAHWLPTTEIPWLAHAIPSWMGLWFSVFPTVETLGAQGLAGLLVFGSYFSAQPSKRIQEGTRHSQLAQIRSKE